VVALVTDNAANVKKARELVTATQDYGHIIELRFASKSSSLSSYTVYCVPTCLCNNEVDIPYRCYMHGFHLVIGSILSYAWAKAVVADAQRIVTYFKASHFPLEKLYGERDRQGIKTGLVTSNATRFTSVADMMNSLLVLRHALQSIASAALVTVPRVLKINKSDRFWINLKSISMMLQPFTLVVMAIQHKEALLADVFRCTIPTYPMLYLLRKAAEQKRLVVKPVGIVLSTL
jgi:hypothetical protein